MSAPTIHVENRCPSLCLVGLRTAGHTPPLDSDRGVAARGPDLAARCVFLLSGIVALRAAGNMLIPP
eukprot:2911406-Pyramimonas_sp.AAC.1